MPSRLPQALVGGTMLLFDRTTRLQVINIQDSIPVDYKSYIWLNKLCYYSLMWIQLLHGMNSLLIVIHGPLTVVEPFTHPLNRLENTVAPTMKVPLPKEQKSPVILG